MKNNFIDSFILMSWFLLLFTSLLVNIKMNLGSNEFVENLIVKCMEPDVNYRIMTDYTGDWIAWEIYICIIFETLKFYFEFFKDI